MADFHATGRAPNCMIKLKIMDNGLAKPDANILYRKGDIPSGGIPYTICTPYHNQNKPGLEYHSWP